MQLSPCLAEIKLLYSFYLNHYNNYYNDLDEVNQSLPSNVYVGTHNYWSIVSQRWGTYSAIFNFPINTDKYNITLTEKPIVQTSEYNVTVDDYDVRVTIGCVDVQFKVGSISIGDSVNCVFNVTPK